VLLWAHVCGRCSEPKFAAGRPLPGGYREGGKTKNRTLANPSRWPTKRIEQLCAVLLGDKLLPAVKAVEIVRALPHGYVLAALGTARRIARRRATPPGAATPAGQMPDLATASHSLGEMLVLGKLAAKEVYASLDWLGREQPFIEATLARHLKDGAPLLYYVTSRLLTGPEKAWALAPG
jgi:hypothetical protein